MNQIFRKSGSFRTRIALEEVVDNLESSWPRSISPLRRRSQTNHSYAEVTGHHGKVTLQIFCRVRSRSGDYFHVRNCGGRTRKSISVPAVFFLATQN